MTEEAVLSIGFLSVSALFALVVVAETVHGRPVFHTGVRGLFWTSIMAGLTTGMLVVTTTDRALQVVPLQGLVATALYLWWKHEREQQPLLANWYLVRVVRRLTRAAHQVLEDVARPTSAADKPPRPAVDPEVKAKRLAEAKRFLDSLNLD